MLDISGVAAPIPAHPHFILPAHSPQFTQGSGSDQTASWEEHQDEHLEVSLDCCRTKNSSAATWVACYLLPCKLLSLHSRGLPQSWSPEIPQSQRRVPLRWMESPFEKDESSGVALVLATAVKMSVKGSSCPAGAREWWSGGVWTDGDAGIGVRQLTLHIWYMKKQM